MPTIRDVLRTDNWWNYKIPPLLGLAFLASLLYQSDGRIALVTISVVLLVGFCGGSYGHFVNDIFDMAADNRAQKANAMQTLPPWLRLSACLGTLFAGFAIAIAFNVSRTTLFLLGIEYLLPTIYAIPPIRLKERGFLGVLCDALGAHAIPTLGVLSLLRGPAPILVSGFDTIALLPWMAGVWSLMLGIKGILIHQQIDRQDDIKAAVQTFATKHSESHVQSIIKVSFAVEIAAFCCLIYLARHACVLLAIFAAMYVAMILLRRLQLQGNGAASLHSPLVQWCYASNSFYESYLPLVTAITIALRHVAFVPLPLLIVLLFFPNFRSQVEAIWSLLRSFRQQIARA